MGQAQERAGDCRAALEAYGRAFGLPEERNPVWYLLHNNYGYCLNLVGRYVEAEEHCRAAIQIHPRRHNARKNLGVSLEGQGRNLDAAKSYITATMANPGDTRAFEHLENLISTHPAVLEQDPDLQRLWLECYKKVRGAFGKTGLQ
jgi:tetratricopeptide (TPR) repeat protein